MVSSFDLCSDDWDTIGELIKNNPNMIDGLSIDELQSRANSRVHKDRKKKKYSDDYDDLCDYLDERVVIYGEGN